MTAGLSARTAPVIRRIHDLALQLQVLADEGARREAAGKPVDDVLREMKTCAETIVSIDPNHVRAKKLLQTLAHG